MNTGTILIISTQTDPIFVAPDSAVPPPLLLHVLQHLHRHWDTLMAEGYTVASVAEQMGGKAPEVPNLNATSIKVQWDEQEVREIDVTSSLPKAKLKVLLDTLPSLAERMEAELEAVFRQTGEYLDGILEDEFHGVPALPGVGLFGKPLTGEANRGRRDRRRRYHLLRV